MRSDYLVAVAVLLVLLTCASVSHAQEASPPRCGKGFMVTGDIQHYKVPASIKVQGADKPEEFVEEVFGDNFVATVEGLPEGQYTIEIDLAETFHKEAGQRLMDISCGDKKLAEKLDIFAAAGGYAKSYIVKGEVTHKADSIGGPLAITFTAIKDKAKFNAIHISDAAGKHVACVLAGDLAEFVDKRQVEIPDIKEPVVYTNPDLPVDQRVDDLIRRMSVKEKVQQLLNTAPAIERLHVPAYDYWNECLHGVARAGHATVFPQAIGMAATWDTPLIHTEADTIATEARAKYNDAIARNQHARYFGLDFWTPNINLFRDPRWGRGMETYGEDPFLTGRVAVAFITGLQGDDPHIIKALACAKHFAVHSGPESSRHVFDAKPTERELYDTYLPHFEAAVREGHVGSIMGAYNSVYGEPCCSNTLLLRDLLRNTWGFKGYVVSDCDAISDIWQSHQVVPTAEAASARAVKAGCDLDCGDTYAALVKAVTGKLLTTADIDTALRRVLRGRFLLGMFDPDERNPYAKIPFSDNDSPAHGAVALQAARESIVLLKNDGLLPLNKANLKRVLVCGSNADSTGMLVANYNGDPSHPVSILQGIKDAVGKEVEVTFVTGCPLATQPGQIFSADNPEFKKALDAAAAADAIIYVGGINADLEGEEMSVNFEGFSGGDRTKIELPAVQTQLLKALAATGKPVIFVNCSGSAIAMPWEAQNIPAIVQAWYPGQAGGTAVADVLFGNYNPAGRLPVTFYAGTADLPDFTSYSMKNRTYRFFTGKPLWAFGHGLSYTTFKYKNAAVAQPEVAKNGTIEISCDVTNTGPRSGDEVVQLYVQRKDPAPETPIHDLRAFQRISIAQSQTAHVKLSLPAATLRHWDPATHAYVVAPGEYTLQIGAASDDIRLTTKVKIAP